MKVLLDDSLSQQLQLKDLLSAISQAEAPGLSVLKFSANKQDCGEIYFLGGHFIVHARVNGKAISSQEALDELLRLTRGEFIYYACDSVDALPQQTNELKIDLKTLIDNWQGPKPASEGDLLDKIFNVSPPADKFVPAEPSQTNKSVAISINPGPQTTAHEKIFEAPSKIDTAENVAVTYRDDVDWNLVNALVSTGAPGSGIGNEWGSDGGMIQVSQDLRSVSRGSAWQYPVRRILLFLIIMLIAGFVVSGVIWLFLNAPTARLEPKRYVLPSEKHYLHRTP